MNRVLLVLLPVSALLACHSTQSPREACGDLGASGAKFEGVIRATIGQEESRTLFRLPRVEPTEIRRATESSLCARGERELVSLRLEPPTGAPHRFYVFHVGTSFAIGVETADQAADVLYFFDPDWRNLSTAMVQ